MQRNGLSRKELELHVGAENPDVDVELETNSKEL